MFIKMYMPVGLVLKFLLLILVDCLWLANQIDSGLVDPFIYDRSKYLHTSGRQKLLVNVL